MKNIVSQYKRELICIISFFLIVGGYSLYICAIGIQVLARELTLNEKFHSLNEAKLHIELGQNDKAIRKLNHTINAGEKLNNIPLIKFVNKF